MGRAYEARSTKERIVAMGTFGALAILPDADVAGVALGLDYHGAYGHRGYTHSVLFAVTIAGLAYVVARKWGTRPWFTALLAFLAVISHGLLDAMTYRTRGMPFIWPLSDLRVTFPWRHIPPAPVGTNYLSQRGLEVAAVEFVYFLPVTLAAFTPARARLACWFGRLAFWRNRLPAVTAPVLANGSLAPVAAVAMPFGRRATTRVVAVVGLTVLSMAFANQVLRESRLIAWIERSTEQGVAVSLMTRPQFRHYH